MVMFVIVKSHVPLFDTTNGSDELQGPRLWITVGGNWTFVERPRTPAPLCPVACTATEGVDGSSLVIVNVAVWGPTPDGVKLTSKGKHAPGLITTGNPPDGAIIVNWGFDEEMLLTDKLALPVLQMFSVSRPMFPAQTCPKFTPAGTWIWGTLPRRNVVKNTSIAAEGGEMLGGDFAEAKAAKNRPAPEALPL
jgi:hypothetical protein